MVEVSLLLADRCALYLTRHLVIDSMRAFRALLLDARRAVVVYDIILVNHLYRLAETMIQSRTEKVVELVFLTDYIERCRELQHQLAIIIAYRLRYTEPQPEALLSYVGADHRQALVPFFCQCSRHLP